MLIFQATAARLFPDVTYRILETKIDSIEFHYPFILNNEKDWLTQNNILHAIPQRAKHIRSEKFLYGVFSSIHLNLHKNDFVFTIMNDPVDQVYECFAYLKYVIQKEDKKKDDNRTLTCSNQAKKAQSEALSQFNFASIENFVDKVLDDFDFSFEYLGVSYKSIRENIYSFDNFSHLNYIGKYNNLDKTFEKLSEIFNKKILPPEDKKSLSYKGEFYRRKDLEKKFKDKIDFYNSI